MDTNPRVIISANNITQQFTVGEEVITPIQNASFELLESSFNIIYGQSGSGKSTLLNTLTGLQPPTSGTVTFDNNEIYNLTPDQRARFRAVRLGIVYQTNHWVQSLTALENVAMPLYFLGYSRARAAEAAQYALEQVEMGSYAKKYPALLSGGEQQRIAMARALASSPLFIIADEPTGNLDSANGDKIMNLLRTAQHDNHRTIILVTHNMEYLPFADHLLHIEDGHIEQLRHDSIKKTTDALLAQMQARIKRLNQTKRDESIAVEGSAK